MSILRDPIKVLDQIEWFLDNQQLEKFPGSYVCCAGNLSRQLLEQILFILSFYCCLPSKHYIKPNLQLRSLDQIWKSLQTINPKTQKNYIDTLKFLKPRLNKFSKLSKSINKWKNEFNESSHYRNPVIPSRTKEKHLRIFVQRLRPILDSKDSYLIIAAVNVILSRGKVMVGIGNDPMNTPFIIIKTVLSPEDLIVTRRKLEFKSKKYNVQIVPSDKEVSLLKWKNRVILVEGTNDMRMAVSFFSEDGIFLNMNSFKEVLKVLGSTPERKDRILARLNKIGINMNEIPDSDMGLRIKWDDEIILDELS